MLSRKRLYFPGLNGMRALAAGCVIIAHSIELSRGGMPAGRFDLWQYLDVAVSVFFALSGFLIYLPFARGHKERTHRQTVLHYLWKRILRVLPAYWLALSVLWLVSAIEPFGFDMGLKLGSDWWKFYLLFQFLDFDFGLVSHFYMHFWAIFAEVSFYFFIPFWSVAIRWGSRRVRSPLRVEGIGLASLVFVGILFRHFASHSARLVVQPGPLNPEGTPIRKAMFSWFPAHIETFGVGMLLAVLFVHADDLQLRERFDRIAQRAWLWWLLASALFLTVPWILGSIPEAGYSGRPWHFREFIYSAMAFCIIVPFVFGDLTKGLIRGFLNSAVLSWVGMISYGVYIWHNPVMGRLVERRNILGGLEWSGLFGWRRGEVDWLALALVTFAVAVVVGSASWYLVEKPLGALRGLFSRTPPEPPEPPEPPAVAAQVTDV